MMMPKAFQSCVLPVVFETGIEIAPHAVFGSCFLIGFQGRVFAITARHVLRPDGYLNPMCVRSPGGWLFTLKDVFFLPLSTVPDDFADLVIVEIDIKRLTGDIGESRILPLERSDEDWLPLRYVSPFVILGFPGEHTFMDYDTGEVVEGLVELVGQYSVPAPSRYLHEITIENPPPLESYSGFSGGPVLALKYSVAAQIVPIFCGVAVQGTATSRTVRFIERSILLQMLDAKIAS